MRFKRLMNATVLEIEKAKLMEQFSTARHPQAVARPIVAKLLGSLNYLDYAVLAFRLGKRLIRIFRK